MNQYVLKANLISLVPKKSNFIQFHHHKAMSVRVYVWWHTCSGFFKCSPIATLQLYYRRSEKDTCVWGGVGGFSELVSKKVSRKV